VSADTPAAVHDDRVREDHARSAKPDRPPPAERASNGQAEAGRPQQPAQALNRADYNRARQDQPPIQRPGDGGSRAQGDTTARGLGGNGDRRADQATSGRQAEAAVGGHPRPDSLNRADHNRARHEAPPIQRFGDNGHQEPPGAGMRAGGGDGTRRAEQHIARRPAETVTGERPREGALDRAEDNEARHDAAPAGRRQAERSEDGQDARTGRLRNSEDESQHDHGGAPSAVQHEEGERPMQEMPPARLAEAGSTAATGERQDADGGDRKAGGQAQPGEPEKIYIDGHEIEVTGDPADGLWIQGLPGKVPDKAGDAFATPEKQAEEKARSDKVFGHVVEVSDDLFDSVEKNANVASQVMERPPTHAEIPVSVQRPMAETQYHTPEAGSIATATLALGITVWAGGRWISERLKGVHDARDR